MVSDAEARAAWGTVKAQDDVNKGCAKGFKGTPEERFVHQLVCQTQSSVKAR